jgi:hypothetical protein
MTAPPPGAGDTLSTATSAGMLFASAHCSDVIHLGRSPSLAAEAAPATAAVAAAGFFLGAMLAVDRGAYRCIACRAAWQVFFVELSTARLVDRAGEPVKQRMRTSAWGVKPRAASAGHHLHRAAVQLYENSTRPPRHRSLLPRSPTSRTLSTHPAPIRAAARTHQLFARNQPQL